MRWRLLLFFLSATAMFCFMLLTSVTDYGSPERGSAVSLSSVRQSSGDEASLLSLIGRPQSAAVAPSAPAPRLEREIRPNTVRFFVPDGADPIMARREKELAAGAERGNRNDRFKLKWDEGGWHREELALVTAYCPCAKCCGTHSPGITSIGKNAWTPGLAADPIYLGYGTRVFVPGYGLSLIDDTGGAMRRHWRRDGLLHIDVRMTYHYEARQWGKQYIRVKIYDDE